MSGLTQFHFVVNAENIVHLEKGLILLSPECTASFLNEGHKKKLCFLMPLWPLRSIKSPSLSPSWENLYFFA